MKKFETEVLETTFEAHRNPRTAFVGARHFCLVMGDEARADDHEMLMFILGRELVEQGLATISIVDGHSQIEFKFMTEKPDASSAIN